MDHSAQSWPKSGRQPVSVSGRNEAFLRAAISEPLVLCYYCSLSHLWQLLTVEVVLHMRFLLLGQQSLPLFFFFKITCGRKPIIFIRILCLCVYNFPVISRCKLVRNKACLSFTGANSFNFFFNNMSPKTMHQLMKIFTLKGSEYHSGILSKFPK